MSSVFEYTLFASVCFFPFMLFAYYPLRYFKRFSTPVTIILELAAALIEIIFFVAALRVYMLPPAILAVCIILFNPLAYKLIYKVSLGRILFNLMLIVNYATFTVVGATLMRAIFFPEMLSDEFHWTYSLCLVIMELIFLLPVSLFTKHFSDDMIKDNSFDFIWRFVWILPLALSAIGCITFYQPVLSSPSSLFVYKKSLLFCGLIVLCLMMVYYYIARMIRQQQTVIQLQKDLYYHSIQKTQYEKIEQQILDTRALRHDLRHHILLMCSYADRQEYDKLSKYLHQYSQSIQQLSQLHYTDNSVLNTLLIYYASLCQSNGIAFEVNLRLPDTLPLDDSELTTVIGNLLENAYHACHDMDSSEPRSISVQGAYKSHFYLFIIDNTFCNELKKDSAGNFITTKPQGSGIGIRSVREILENHGGTFTILTNNDHFEVSFSLPEK